MELVSRYTKCNYYTYSTRSKTSTSKWGYKKMTYTSNNTMISQPQELVAKYLRVRAMWNNPRLTCV